jgi:uncharacterized protein
MNMKKFFVIYLIPPRPDFPQTMTAEEKGIMGQHVTYWMEKMQKGEVFAFGPVMDPKGAYGLGIISVNDENELADFVRHDPASTINEIQFFPMLATVPAHAS